MSILENLSIHEKRDYFTELLFTQKDALPERYVFILTAKCNLRCSFCYQNHTEDTILSAGEWIAFAKQLPGYARVTLVGGEPFLYPDFDKVADYVGARYQMNCITNGLLLTNERTEHLLSLPMLKVLSVSIDTIGNTNRGFTSGQWEGLVKKIKYFVKRKRELHRDDVVLDIKTVLYGANTAQLYDLYIFIKKELQCDTNSYTFLCGSEIQCNTICFSEEDLFAPSRAPVLENFAETLEALEAIRAYSITHGYKTFLVPRYVPFDSREPLTSLAPFVNMPTHDPALYQVCKYPWSNLMVTPDGLAYPCLSYAVGKIGENNLKDIITGAPLAHFRSLILGHGTLPACNRCVWLKREQLTYS